MRKETEKFQVPDKMGFSQRFFLRWNCNYDYRLRKFGARYKRWKAKVKI